MSDILSEFNLKGFGHQFEWSSIFNNQPSIFLYLGKQIQKKVRIDKNEQENNTANNRRKGFKRSTACQFFNVFLCSSVRKEHLFVLKLWFCLLDF